MDGSLSIKIEGEDELAQRLASLAVGLEDLTRPFDQIGEYLTGFFSGEVFASRGQVIGEPWPDLSDEYAAQKAIDFPGRPPLIRSGLMNERFREESDDSSVLIYNEQEYFDRHQLGLGVPQRVMMKVDDTRQDRIVAFVADEVDRKVERS